MKYAKYDEYLPSRLEWVDAIPKHWDITRLRLISRRYSGGTPSKDKPEYWQEGTVPWLNSGEVNQGTITQPSEYITELGLKESSAKWIPEHAIIVALAGQGKTKGTAAYTTFKTTCNQSMGVIVFEKDLPRYMYWWLVSQYKNIRGMASDDSRDGLNLEMLGTIPCPIPSIEEQKKIAAFLDYKTQQIDQLIEKKKELIDKLKEKRITVITQAVTKGLDENAKLKPSGVDWLGDVPAHWHVIKFKYFIGFQEGPGIMSVDFRDEGVPLLRIRNVQGATVDMDDCNFLDKNMVEKTWTHFKCKEGDLIISGSASTGLVSEVKGEAVGSIVYTGLIRLWPDNDQIVRDYIRLLVSSELFFSQIEQFKTGSTIQHFGPEHLRQMLITLPPVNEQLPIVEKAKQETDYISNLISKAQEVLGKLNEYRSAIITSAVTGKIDVREVDIPEGSA